ncbi:hypothetical protein ACWDUN_22845 [Mycobacterium sp. NPDC003323]
MKEVNPMPTRYDRSAAQNARQAILNSLNRFWKPADLDTAPSTTQHLLAELVNQGELRHLRRGLYWRGLKTPLGMAPPQPDLLAAELAGVPGIGPAGLSAANALQLSTQIPRRGEYAIPARPPADYELVRFANRSARRGRADAALTPIEVATLEVLDRWDQVIETSPDAAMTRLTELIDAGRLDAERLAEASDTEPASVRARLRHLLQRTGRTELADKVRRADLRTEVRALAGLTST